MSIKVKNNVVIDDNRNITGEIGLRTAGPILEKYQYINTFAGTNLSKLRTIDGPLSTGTPRFGFSIGADNTTKKAIVGSPGDNGLAYIYDIVSGSLSFTLTNPNAYSTAAGDSFGGSVAISGNYAAVAAAGEDDTTGLSSGKVYIFDSTSGSLLWTLNNPNPYGTGSSDNFGWSISLSGIYLAVGVLYEDDAGGLDSGKVYVYDVTTGTLLWTLNNPNSYSTSLNDNFGISVSVDGNYLAVGAPYEESRINSSAGGVVYVYNVTTGSLLYTLNQPLAYGLVNDEFFGINVSVSGNYLAVGASGEDSRYGGGSSGAVYIYDLSVNAKLVNQFVNPSSTINNSYESLVNSLEPRVSGITAQFGRKVSIRGNYVLIATTSYDQFSGTAYLYNIITGKLEFIFRNPTPWGSVAYDRYGEALEILDDYVIIGAWGERGEYGKIYVYPLENQTIQVPRTYPSPYVTKINKSDLLMTYSNPNAYSTSAGDNFGQSVAISGNYAVIGAYYEDDASGTNSGAAYVINVKTNSIVCTLLNPNAYNTSLNDNFGSQVAIYENYVAVSAQQEDDASGNESGKVYIFNATTGALLWTLNNPNPYSTSVGDYFGASLAMYGDYLAVGALYEDSATSGDGAGKVYIYNVTTGTLVRTIDNPSVTFPSDAFGYSIDMYQNNVIIGAPFESEDGSNSNSGRVYVYNILTGALVQTFNNPNTYSTASGDNFGSRVAIFGNNVAIVAWTEDSATALSSGTLYLFALDTGVIRTTINNPTGTSNGILGLAINDTVVAIGDRYASAVSGETDSGKVYVYNLVNYSLLNVIENPNSYSTKTSDNFGHSICISQNKLIVGSLFEEDSGGGGSGKAYLFSLYTESVTEQENIIEAIPGQLKYTIVNPNAYNTTSGDSYGIGVAISGNYIVSGAYTEDTASNVNTGRIYVHNASTGKLLWTATNPNAYSTGEFEYFGLAIDIDGNYIIAGAADEDDAGGLDSGKAYIFNAETGALVWTLNNPNAYSTSAGDIFGVSVAISGNFAIVGSRFEDNTGGLDSGIAYIFNVTTGALVHTLNNPSAYSTSAGDEFGRSVAIDGNYAIVGAYEEDDTLGTASGKAYIFNVTTGALLWTLNNPNVYGSSTSDRFGIDVSISGNFAIVGAYGEDAADGLDSGKAYIYNVTTGALIHTLSNPNAYSTGLSDQFGFTVDISDNYAIVGAYTEDDATGSSSGKAYIYNVTTGGLVQTLNNPNAYSNTGTQDFFGQAVAISGNYAVVGAWGEDSGGGTESGSVYVFTVEGFQRQSIMRSASDFGYVRKNAAGSLVWTLNNPNAYSTSADDRFGENVAVSGNFAIVGAYGEDDAGGLTSGKAYIYNVTTGALVHTLNNPNAYSASEGDQFGYSVAISDRYAIVGAKLEDDPQASSAAAGRVYIFDIYSGSLVQSLRNPALSSGGWNSGMNFGYSVGISGNYAIVGTPYRSDPLASAGKAYIFNVTTGQLLWTLDNPNAYGSHSNDTFGWAVAISGNYAIVGTPNEDSAIYTEFGIAYIYNVTTGQLLWTLNNPNAYSGSFNNDEFGNAVAISGNFAIVGAWREDDAGGTESGKAYVFNVTTGALVQTLNNPNAYGIASNDQFGYSVGISGNFAIVGARFDSDIGGSFSGKAYIFNVTTGQLLWTLNNPSAYSTSFDDQFGSSVAISGNYVIIGAFAEDDAGGTNSGKAYIFSVNDTYRLTNVEEIQLANGMKISADNKLLQQSVPAGALIHKLDNPNAYSVPDYDLFGSAVSISGNYALVSARGEDDISGFGSGKAYVFNLTTGSLISTINNPNVFSTSTGDEFGRAASISGNSVIVGTYAEDDAGGNSSGIAHIFDARTGALVWTLNNPNAYSTSAGDNFGYSVDISGNYAIVGATNPGFAGEDDAGGTSSGKAYVFNVSTGTLLYTLNNPNVYSTSQDDYFGTSVAISGNYAIVGASGEADSLDAGSGKVYVFSLQTGALLYTINNPNVYPSAFAGPDNFGWSIAAYNNRLIASAYQEEDFPNGVISSGKAYIFDLTNGTLLWTLNNPNAYSVAEYDYFGRGKVSISSRYASVSAYDEDSLAGTQSGVVYIFDITNGSLVHTLYNPNSYGTGGGDTFGFSTCISDNYIISGAVNETNSSGVAYIFSVRDLTNLDRLLQLV